MDNAFLILDTPNIAKGLTCVVVSDDTWEYIDITRDDVTQQQIVNATHASTEVMPLFSSRITATTSSVGNNMNVTLHFNNIACEDEAWYVCTVHTASYQRDATAVLLLTGKYIMTNPHTVFIKSNVIL